MSQMTKRIQTSRERAARALCTSRGLPENTLFEGRPMWQSVLDEVDIVLSAALTPEAFAAIKAEDKR